MAYTITQNSDLTPAHEMRDRSAKGRMSVINEKLINSADKGLNYATIDFNLTIQEKNMIKNSGYTIEEKKLHDEPYFVVKW